MRDAEQSEDIVLKRSGKRARLEVTVDDEPAVAVSGTVVPRPRSAAATQVPIGRASVAPRTRVIAAPPAVPPGGPPVHYVHDEPGGSWWQSRSASVITAVVLAVSLVVVACVLLLGGSDGKQPIATELANSRNAVQSVISQANSATRLAQIRSAGHNAHAQLGRLDSPAANVAHSKHRSLAQPAGELIAAERSYLSALSDLADVDYSVAADPRLTRWQSIKARIVETQRPLSLAAAGVDRLALPTSAGPLLITQGQIGSTLDHLDATVTGANNQIMLYQRRLRAYQSSKTRAASSASPLIAYRDRVNQLLASYAAGRNEVSVWAAGVRDIHPSNADEAAAKVDGFITARQDIINQLQDALGDAPLSVRTAHRDLGVPLSDSLDGLQAAYAAIEETSMSSDPQSDPTSSSSWIRFEDASTQVERSLATARSAWGQAISLEIHKMRSSGIAMHPKKPRV
jgi:hypothetical protein